MRWFGYLGFFALVLAACSSAEVPRRSDRSIADTLASAVGYGTRDGGVFDRGAGRLVGIVRSCRTAKLALPETQAQSLEFPTGDKTTVLPTSDVRCFLQSANLDNRVPATRGQAALAPGACENA